MNKKDRKPHGYWTYERCYEEALNYKTRQEFYDNNLGAYQAAKGKKWLDDYTWFLSKNEAISLSGKYWTKERCLEEAKKYKTRGEFSKNKSQAYFMSLKYGILDEVFGKETSQKPKRYWTYEKCKEEAMKFEYLTDFKGKSMSAYDASRRYNWIKDFTWLKKYKTNEGPFDIYVYEDVENKVVYVGLTNNIKRRHYHHKNGIIRHGVRKFDIVHNYFESIGKEIPTPIIKMHELDFAKDAQYYENLYRDAYERLGWKTLNIAKTGENISSIGGKRKWTEEKINEEIKRLNCTSRWDLGKKNYGAYAAAIKLGIIEKLFPNKLH